MGKPYPRRGHCWSRFYLMNACIALVLHIAYWLSIGDKVAPSHRQNYNAERMDAFPKIAVSCYHLIWMTWLIEKAIWGVTQPSPLQVGIGIALFVPAMSLVVWAMQSNPFFMPNLYLPPRIIEAGPYRYFRHPGYLGMFFMAGATYLILGHFAGVFPLSAYWIMLGIRVRQENRLLYG